MRATTKAAAALSCAIALLAQVAHADAPREAEAKERFGRGIDLYEQGDYGGALAEFTRAHDLAPYAVILYNLGLTYEKLGRPVEAVDAMQRVMAAPGSLSAERVARAQAVAREQSARVAEITVETSSPGAVVDLDGVEIAKTPFIKPLRVKGGPHRVGVVLPGFAPSRKQVDVAAGSKQTVKFELVPTDKRLAHLDVRASVVGAQVAVDNVVVGETPLAATVAILPGAHDLEVRRAGYRTARRHVDVGEASTGDLRFDLEEDLDALRATGGDLQFVIDESQSVVFVDGKPQSSASAPLRLASGPHRVRVERAGFFPVERDVDVPARGHALVRVRLEPTADFRAAYEKKAKFYRTGAYVGLVAGALVAGGGVTFALVTKGKRDDAGAAIDAKNASGSCAGSLTPNQEIACQQFGKDQTGSFNRNESYMVAGWIVTAAGGAIVGTGLTLFLVGDSPHRYDRKAETLADVRLLPSYDPKNRTGFLGVRGAF